MQVLLLVEVDAVLLPELLSVARSPSELLSLNLLLEFLDRAEHLLVLVKELKQFLEKLVDIIVNPMSVLQLDD